MSILWMDDPNFYATAQLQVRYDNSPTGAVIVGSGGRFSNNCWQFTGTTTIQKNVAAIQTGTLGASINISSITTSRAIFQFSDSNSLQCDLRVDLTGHLVVTRNGTTLATSTNALSLNVWYRIEMKLKVDPSVGTIEVRVNGSSTGWIPSTGSLNTRATANSTFNQVSLGPAGTSMLYNANDFVYTDSNSPNADFLGEVRCYLRMPNANSSVTWTPNPGGNANWQNVDETPVDGDTTYNSSATPGQIDLFTLPNLPGGANGILAVDNVIYSRKDDAGTRTIQGRVSSGGTTQNTASQTMSTSYQFLDQIMETDPHTSAAWTAANANALLVGYDEIA